MTFSSVPHPESRMVTVIAVDGPAGAGKSTLARDLARKLKVYHVDSGAFYRAVTYYALKNGFESKGEHLFDDPRFFEGICLKVLPYGNQIGPVELNGEPLGDHLRSWEVTQWVSRVSAHPAVREFVNWQLRKLSRDYPLVIDGRDIGTVVFPDAPIKFYVTCNLRERARRRQQEMMHSGEDAPSFEEVFKNINARDESDTTRTIAPLRVAPDAFYIDTTSLTPKEQLNQAVAYIRQRMPDLLGND